MIKSYKVRIYPTKQQEELMWKHIGSCRFIWNYMLDKQNALHERGERHLSAIDMINILKPLKNDGEHEWLYDVSNTSLQKSCQDLQKAYEKFFRRQGGFPKFKRKKRSKNSFPVRESIWFDGKTVHIEKVGKVKYKTDFNLPVGRGDKFSNPRITYKSNKWILSFGLECENQAYELSDKTMGIDLGIKDLAVVSYGDEQIVFHNINKSKKVRNLKRRLRHTQKTISRKYEANRQGNRFVKTNNIIKEEEKLRQLYDRLTNIRNNYLHQTTHTLVSLLPYRIVMEDLNVRGMMKNRHLAKAIAEQCFNEFIRQMQYKSAWCGIEFVQADRFYPSSKTCSQCGCIKKDLKLRDRTYVCDECGFTIDRDYNAAINLMRYVV